MLWITKLDNRTGKVFNRSKSILKLVTLIKYDNNQWEVKNTSNINKTIYVDMNVDRNDGDYAKQVKKCK